MKKQVYECPVFNQVGEPIHPFSCHEGEDVPGITLKNIFPGLNNIYPCLNISLNIKKQFRKNQKEDLRMMNTKIDIEALEQVTGGRGYDRDDDPKHDGEGEYDFRTRYGVPVARWFLNTEVGRWVSSIIS